MVGVFVNVIVGFSKSNVELSFFTSTINPFPFSTSIFIGYDLFFSNPSNVRLPFSFNVFVSPFNVTRYSFTPLSGSIANPSNILILILLVVLDIISLLSSISGFVISIFAHPLSMIKSSSVP